MRIRKILASLLVCVSLCGCGQKNFITSIDIKGDQVTVYENHDVSLDYSIVGTYTTDNYKWTVSDETIASISSEGVVTGLKIGTAYVTLQSTLDTKICDSIAINVVYYSKITGIDLSIGNTYSMNIDEKVNIGATAKPSDASEQTFSYASTDPSIAEIDSDGNVTAIKDGTCSLKVTSTVFANIKAECELTVLYEPVTEIILNSNSQKLNVGDSFKLVATVNPSDATYNTIKWSSSNESVASVTDGVVKGLKQGTAVITVASGKNFEKTATCEFVVSNVVATEISMPKTLNLTNGDTYTLSPTINPTNTTNKNITYSSSNSSVCSVSSTGLLTAKGVGSATITAKMEEGNASATCAVNITEAVVKSIKLSSTSLEVSFGSINTITAEALPEAASNKTISWICSNTSVVSISTSADKTSCTITASNKVGTATITASTANGVSATCNVSVIKANSLQSSTLTPTQTMPVVVKYCNSISYKPYSQTKIENLSVSSPMASSAHICIFSISFVMTKTYDYKGENGTSYMGTIVMVYDSNNNVVLRKELIYRNCYVGTVQNIAIALSFDAYDNYLLKFADYVI